MIRSLLIAVGLFSLTLLMSSTFFCYSRAGKDYISKQREKRKSIRPGVGYYGVYGYGRRGGFRGGK